MRTSGFLVARADWAAAVADPIADAAATPSAGLAAYTGPQISRLSARASGYGVSLSLVCFISSAYLTQTHSNNRHRCKPKSDKRRYFHGLQDRIDILDHSEERK